MDSSPGGTWPELPGFMRSPNIATDADLYEIENLAADPDRAVEQAMQHIASWEDKVVMDVGAGAGYHIDRFHAAAAQVIAVEPDPALRLRMMQRIADRKLERTSVIGASAVDIPLRDHSVDIVHSRFAYFFGPGCDSTTATTWSGSSTSSFRRTKRRGSSPITHRTRSSTTCC